MRQFSLLVDVIALAAVAQYFRAAALPLIKSRKLYPAMGVRPTLVNRTVLVSATLSVVFFSIDLVFVLLTSEAPLWALIVRLVGLWVTFLISIAAFKFAPVEPLPAVRDAVAAADAREVASFEEPENAAKHALDAVAAWERVIELAPENAGVRDRLARALGILATHLPERSVELNNRARRESQLADAFREAHDRIERPAATR